MAGPAGRGASSRTLQWPAQRLRVLGVAIRLPSRPQPWNNTGVLLSTRSARGTGGRQEDAWRSSHFHVTAGLCQIYGYRSLDWPMTTALPSRQGVLELYLLGL